MTRREALMAGAFFSLMALLTMGHIFRGEVLFDGDASYSFHPWLSFGAQNIAGGLIPLWDPYSVCGQPFLANPGSMVFYPGALAFWTLPFAPASDFFLLLHEALIFAAAYLLARRWGLGPGPALLAGTALAFGGFTVVHWEFASALATLPWILFLLLFSLTASWVCAGLAACLLFMGGYTQFSIYGVLAAGLGMACQCAAGHKGAPSLRRMASWALAMAAGVILALPHILPAWEMTLHSLRSRIGGEAAQYLLTPFFLVKFLIPAVVDKVHLAFSDAVFGAGFWPIQRNWLNTFFIGTGPFLLGIAGFFHRPRAKTAFLALLAVFSLCLSFGWEPVFSGLRHIVPGMRYMTHFSNVMILTILALSLSAGSGLKAVEEKRGVFWPLWALCLAGSLALAASSPARAFLIQKILGLASLSENQDRWVAGGSLKCALSLCALAGALRSSGWAGKIGGVLLLTALELWAFGSDIHLFTAPDRMREKVELASRLQASPYRLSYDPWSITRPVFLNGESLAEGYAGLRQILHPNFHLPYRVPITWGYEVFPLLEFTEFRRTVSISTESAKLKPSPQLDFLGGRYVVSYQPLPKPYRFLARRPEALLYENPDALPRVSWVPRSVVMGEKSERLEYLSTHWNPREEIVFEERPGAGPAEPLNEEAGGPMGNITWNEAPGSLKVSGRSPAPGWLSVAQTFYPGWEARVNGKRAALLRANHAFQAVPVPAGNWSASLAYDPAVFKAGTLLSLAGWLCLAVFSCKKISRL